MSWLLLLAAAAGVLIWLGRRSGRAGGDWRTAAILLSAASATGAVVALARGAWPLAAGLFALAAFVAAAARRRIKPAEGRMSEAEARALLGVGPDATAEEVRAAWRRLMAKVHPDAGGTAELAARLTRARDRLQERDMR